MADPVVHLTNGVPDSGTGNVTTLGQTMLDGANATLGVTTGAAVTTSAAGTIQQYLRGIVSLLVSGITVASHAVTNAGTFAVQSTLQAGSALIGIVKIGDGTNTATVKAASTAALATDTALVVAISPNSSGSLAQGSTTSGQTGALVQGAVTTAAPTYTTAQTSPLSLDAAGNLRVGATDQYATHKEVGASATATVLGATGAIGDYLDSVTVYPGVVGCGLVTILDGSTAIGTFAGGGTTALPSCIPFVIPVGAFCTGAGWHITTGVSVTVSCKGKFT